MKINNFIAEILKINNLTPDELPESKEFNRNFENSGYFICLWLFRWDVHQCSWKWMFWFGLYWKKIIGSCQLPKSIIWTWFQWEKKTTQNKSSPPLSTSTPDNQIVVLLLHEWPCFSLLHLILRTSVHTKSIVSQYLYVPMNMLHNQLSEMLWTIVTRFLCNTETLHYFPFTLKASSFFVMYFSFKNLLMVH